MTTKLFGEQVLDEIRREGLTYSIFEKAERERLCKIRSRSDLRAFYDELRFDCVSVVGSPSELVQTLKRQYSDSANSRGWQAFNEHVDIRFKLNFKLFTYALCGFLLLWLLIPERSIFRFGLNMLCIFGGRLVALTCYRGFEFYRCWRRGRVLKVLSETESQLLESVV